MQADPGHLSLSQAEERGHTFGEQSISADKLLALPDSFGIKGKTEIEEHELTLKWSKAQRDSPGCSLRY